MPCGRLTPVLSPSAHGIGSRDSRCCLSMAVWSSRERRGLVLLTWNIHILHSVVIDVVVSWYLFSRFRILTPKQKARKSCFYPTMHGGKRLVLSLSSMKGCVLRGKGWLFQEVRIPKNVDIFVYKMMHRGMRHENWCDKTFFSQRCRTLSEAVYPSARHSVQRIAQNPHRISVRRQSNRQRMAQSRNWQNGILKTCGLAFDYSPVTDYTNQPELNIGMMDVVCRHCQALLYRDEPKGMCCNGVKLKL